MDGDSDEDNAAYFLPNGIADDSPPKRSFAPSFGRIGGPSPSIFGSTPVIDPNSRSRASSSTSLPQREEFGHTIAPPPGLKPPPSRQNFLLSELGGQIHEPKPTVYPQNSYSSSHSFGYTGGSFGNSQEVHNDNRGVHHPLDHSHNATIGYRATNDPFMMSTGRLYSRSSGLGSSFLGRDSMEGSGHNSSRLSTSNWSDKPRRPLQSPPGLTKSIGLGSNTGTGLLSQPTHGFHTNSSFQPAPSQSFGQVPNQFDAKFRSELPSLQIAADERDVGATTRSRGNSDLAELNARSVMVGERKPQHAVQSDKEASVKSKKNGSTTPTRLAISMASANQAVKSPRSDEKPKVVVAQRTKRSFAERNTRRIDAQSLGRSGQKKDQSIETMEDSSETGRSKSGDSRQITNSTPRSSPGLSDSATSAKSRRKDKSNDSSEKSTSLGSKVSQTESVIAPNAGETEAVQAPPGFKSKQREAVQEEKGGFRTVVSKKTNRRQVYREKLTVPEPSTLQSNPPESTSTDTPVQASDDVVSSTETAMEQGRKVSPHGNKAKPTPQEEISKRREKMEKKRSLKGSAKSEDDSQSSSSSTATAKYDSDKSNEMTKTSPKSNEMSKSKEFSQWEANTVKETEKPVKATKEQNQKSVEENIQKNKQVVQKDSSKDAKAPVSIELDKALDMKEMTQIKQNNSGRSPSSSTAGPVNVTEEPNHDDNESRKESPSEDISLVKKETPVAEPTQVTPSRAQDSTNSTRKLSTKEKGKEKKKKERTSSKSKRENSKSKGESGKEVAVNSPPTSSSSSIHENIIDQKFDGNHTSSQVLSGKNIPYWIVKLQESFQLFSSFVYPLLMHVKKSCGDAMGLIDVRGLSSAFFYQLESLLAVLFSVVLLLALHGASWFIRIHRIAFRAVLNNRHIGFCFVFMYAFPFLVQYVIPWAPPWAPVCLWYAFLVQLFCTNGPTAMVTTFRIILPLLFLIEGVSHHSFLLDLNGAELLLISFILSALKTNKFCSSIFLLSLAAQCLSSVFLGSEVIVQWCQMALALYSLHSMSLTEEEWTQIDEDDELHAPSAVSLHHSIADFNHHRIPAAAAPVQKTKSLDRRSIASGKGRKMR